MTHTATYHSPVGEILLASDGQHLTGLWLESQPKYSAMISSLMVAPVDLPIFDQTKAWLEGYFRGDQLSALDLPILLNGTEFQQRVWRLLQQIPWGETRTYGQLATQVATQMNRERMSAQAVGHAVGKNPISIIVPCHRVLGMNRSLTGYAAGLEVKKQLLQIEQITFKE